MIQSSGFQEASDCQGTVSPRVHVIRGVRGLTCQLLCICAGHNKSVLVVLTTCVVLFCWTWLTLLLFKHDTTCLHATGMSEITHQDDTSRILGTNIRGVVAAHKTCVVGNANRAEIVVLGLPANHSRKLKVTAECSGVARQPAHTQPVLVSSTQPASSL